MLDYETYCQIHDHLGRQIRQEMRITSTQEFGVIGIMQTIGKLAQIIVDPFTNRIVSGTVVHVLELDRQGDLRQRNRCLIRTDVNCAVDRRLPEDKMLRGEIDYVVIGH